MAINNINSNPDAQAPGIAFKNVSHASGFSYCDNAEGQGLIRTLCGFPCSRILIHYKLND
jgi:hypothetical protein